jgi:hypothetical protein
VTYIYAIGLEIRGRSVIKVGVATNVKVRLSDLQIGCPFQLEVLGLWRFAADAETTEALFHLAHINKNRHGEWFNLSLDKVRDFMMRDVSTDMERYGIQGHSCVELEPPTAPRVRSCTKRINYKFREADLRFRQEKRAETKTARRAALRTPKKHQALIDQILSARTDG